MDSGERTSVETWTLLADGPKLVLRAAWARGVATQAVPDDSGRVLMAHHHGGTHTVATALPAAAGPDHEPETVPVPGVRGFRVVPGRSTRPGLAVGYHPGHRSTVWRVRQDPLALDPLVELPGLLTGGVWLDEHRILLTRVHRGTGRVITVHTETAEVAEVGPPTDGGLTQVLLTGPDGHGVASHGTGRDTTLCWWDGGTGGTGPLPPELRGFGPDLRPLAVSPDGGRYAFAADDGIRTRMLLCSRSGARVRELSLPAGTVGHGGGWTGNGLWFPYASTTLPDVLAASTGEGFVTAPLERRTAENGYAAVFDGPAGSVEALVRGPRPGSARRTVIALHGGPESRWRHERDPFLDELAEAGMTVLAPNQRGSTGYGAAHQQALVGAWGVPDLADVLHLARTLRAEGTDLVLYGVSYGAYLALLAAAAEPGLWSGCLAVAGFSSAPTLHPVAPPPVRRMVERLGGLVPADDPIGRRDVLRLAHRITAPVRLVHGARDPVVPIEHARLLAAGLERHVADFAYREVPDGGHYPLAEHGGGALASACAHFLATVSRPGGARPRSAGGATTPGEGRSRTPHQETCAHSRPLIRG
ncbi:alpha/beta hydrolase family protein [Streptomyces sp. NPDC055607]